MRSERVVVSSPTFDQHLGLAKRREHLAVKQLVPELRDEALAVTILPGTARPDEQIGQAPLSIVTLLRDPKTATDLADLLALAQPYFGLTQHSDRLLRRVVLSCHFSLLQSSK